MDNSRMGGGAEASEPALSPSATESQPVPALIERGKRVIAFAALDDRLSAQAGGGGALGDLWPELRPCGVDEAIATLKKWRADNPLYEGDDARSKHYRNRLGTIDAALIALASPTYDHGKRDGIEARADDGQLEWERITREAEAALDRFVSGGPTLTSRERVGFKAGYRSALLRALSGEGREVAEESALDDLRGKAQFLVDRIDNLDWCDFDNLVRDWNGHVDPPLYRLKHALQALATPKPQIAPEIEPIPDSEEG